MRRIIHVTVHQAKAAAERLYSIRRSRRCRSYDDGKKPEKCGISPVLQ